LSAASNLSYYMKFFDNKHVYQSDWETVTSAFWIKYPNELQPHVRSIDTVDRAIDSENKQLKVRRILTLRYDLPQWVERIIGRKLEGMAVEEATCDLNDRKLTLVGRNHSFSEVFAVKETCTYQPHPTNPNWTVFNQNTEYSICGGLFSSMLESQAIQSARSKASTGLKAMSEIIDNLERMDWRNQVPLHMPI